MRLVVAGGKHFVDVEQAERELDRIHAHQPLTVLIHGGHPLLGTMLERWARERRIDVVRYPPNWQYLGNRAEAARNAFMLTDSRPDLALVLPGGRDTRAFARTALGMGVPVVAVRGEGDEPGPDASPWQGDDVEPAPPGRPQLRLLTLA
ncbi:MAG: DUF2493 domain-containing protein [Geminicoccaceae bacterium]|nr:MAG: DUF2493 domain-containing protein [Geminicoccaceae bacterium]